MKSLKDDLSYLRLSPEEIRLTDFPFDDQTKHPLGPIASEALGRAYMRFRDEVEQILRLVPQEKLEILRSFNRKDLETISEDYSFCVIDVPKQVAHLTSVFDDIYQKAKPFLDQDKQYCVEHNRAQEECTIEEHPEWNDDYANGTAQPDFGPPGSLVPGEISSLLHFCDRIEADPNDLRRLSEIITMRSFTTDEFDSIINELEGIDTVNLPKYVVELKNRLSSRGKKF